MAKFLHNSPCHKCGSKDNLATYSDGSQWCWGCRYYKSGNKSPYVESSEVQTSKVLQPSSKGYTTEYSLATTTWLQTYGISVEEAIRRGIFSNQQGNTVFRLGEEVRSKGREAQTSRRADQRHGDVDESNDRQAQPFSNILASRPISICYQTRNHNPLSKQKYYTEGNVNDILPIYDSGVSIGKLIVVEDCLSAIKIARQCDAMPCLRSDLSLTKLARLRHLYDVLVVWLDGDMYHKSVKIAESAKILGFDAFVIHTPEDPKCYNNEQIKGFIK